MTVWSDKFLDNLCGTNHRVSLFAPYECCLKKCLNYNTKHSLKIEPQEIMKRYQNRDGFCNYIKYPWSKCIKLHVDTFYQATRTRKAVICQYICYVITIFWFSRGGTEWMPMKRALLWGAVNFIEEATIWTEISINIWLKEFWDRIYWLFSYT